MNWYEDPVFIKQCEKAVEVQEEKKQIIRGDYWCWSSYHINVYFHSDKNPLEMENRASKRGSRKVWLPNQPQLDGMVMDKAVSPRKLAVYFGLWAQEHDLCGMSGWSTEQLKLAFVYEKKYHKVWDSEKEDWMEEHSD